MDINNNVTIIDVEGVRKVSSQYRIIRHDYNKIREEVIKEIKNFLKAQNGKGFTARELSDLFGLSANSIAQSLSYGEVCARPRIVYTKYVRLCDNGDIDYSHSLCKENRVTEYYLNNNTPHW